MRGGTIHILIVDDSPEDRAVYIRYLERDSDCRYRITTVDLGDEGLDKMREEQPDCIVLDFNLPDMDALEFLGDMSDRPGQNPAVVMITGQGSEHIAVESMKRGVKDYLIKGNITGEKFVAAVTNAVEKQSMQNELEEARIKLEHMALYDPLTGLGNRNLFNTRMEHAVALATRRNDTACLLMIDLDGFKAVNDSYGHYVGDEALREIGQRLMNTGRRSDTVARIGGDEFAYLMETGATMEGAISVANKIIDTLGRPIIVQEHTFRVGASIGISLFSGHIPDADTVIQQADAAMYEAKRSGGGYKVANPVPRPVPPNDRLKLA